MMQPLLTTNKKGVIRLSTVRGLRIGSGWFSGLYHLIKPARLPRAGFSFSEFSFPFGRQLPRLLQDVLYVDAIR